MHLGHLGMQGQSNWGKCTNTATGRFGGPMFSPNHICSIVSKEPLHRSTSVQRLEVNITSAFADKNKTASHPPASSDVAALAPRPECFACIFATGCPSSNSFV